MNCVDLHVLLSTKPPLKIRSHWRIMEEGGGGGARDMAASAVQQKHQKNCLETKMCKIFAFLRFHFV